jgi:hypothetical protein
LQSIRIDRSDADDYDHTGDGHSIDALRFVAMDIPVSENTADPMDVEVKKWERIMRSAKKRQVQAESDYEVSTGYDG